MKEYWGWPTGSLGYHLSVFNVAFKRLLRKLLPWPLQRWLLTVTINERNQRREDRAKLDDYIRMQVQRVGAVGFCWSSFRDGKR